MAKPLLTFGSTTSIFCNFANKRITLYLQPWAKDGFLSAVDNDWTVIKKYNTYLYHNVVGHSLRIGGLDHFDFKSVTMTDRTNGCNCKSYQPLELSRDQVSKRIKESKKILKTLELQAKANDGTVLYRCKFCGQFWQESIAWNWGGKNYLFKVPETSTSDWLDEPFISPAEMLIYSALMTDYFNMNKFIESKTRCQDEKCDRMALERNVLCQHHFIESLKRVGLLPKEPRGKIFEPYSR